MNRRIAPALALALLVGPAAARGQTELPEGPRPVDEFEVDADGDGIPDGWYNLRDAKVAPNGFGAPGSRCLRFENDRPGRPSRASRAFGVDGREVEAIVIGLWVRAEDVAPGERLGDEPALVIDFIGDPIRLRALRRGSLGPWKGAGREWTHVAKRLAIPPDTRLAILSTGLLGATGVLEVDRLTIDLIPIGGDRTTTNLAVNGGFELADPEPNQWVLNQGARRVHPGHHSDSAVELKRAGSRAYSGLAVPVGRFRTLEVAATAKGAGLRGAVAASAFVFFLDDDGKPLPGTQDGVPALNYTGTFGWQAGRASVPVPPGASRALIHFEKGSAYGTLWVDDVAVSGDGPDNRWTPDHVELDRAGWVAVAPSREVEAGSALDASVLLDAPAGRRGPVVVRDGRFRFTKTGERARFFGVSLYPPTAFAEPERADELADHLARSGVNLVRLSELDAPLGPARSLFDDARDDTRELDPAAIARLDHLIAALKRRGIYVAIELQGGRRFRQGDDASIPNAHLLPAGGGAAAAFDPSVREAARRAAELLLGHVNPETGLALRDDPALAWVTLAGELTLFDLADSADKEYRTALDAIRNLMRRDATPNARPGWEAIEADQWKALAADLRKFGLKSPIAGGSHFRRDHDYNAAQMAPGLDLIDDRLYFSPPSWAGPDRRSPLWSLDGGLAAFANRKRRPDRPYVAGQYASPTFGAWASPSEGADLLLAAATAAADDWDALVRRAMFLFPRDWGEAAPGTGGGEDVFAIPEVVNGAPQTYALLPHAASILLRPGPAPVAIDPKGPSRYARATPAAKPAGWSPRDGRLIVDTPHTRALAGWIGDGEAKSDALTIEAVAPLGVVAVTAVGPEPIASARRLLVTAVARVEPTGYRSVDEWRRERADPGLAPLLHETLRGRVTWTRSGTVRAFALDAAGRRAGPAAVEKVDGGWRLAIPPGTPTLHWELVAE